MDTWREFAAAAALLGLLLATPAAAEVVIYPDPGDLGSFQNLRKSERYAVTVNGRRTTVYASNNRAGKDVDGRLIPQGYITDAHFCYFSFCDEAVTLEVTSPDGTGFTRASLHPQRLGLEANTNNGRIVFRMDQPRNIVLKTNDEELHPLVILADAPDIGRIVARSLDRGGVAARLALVHHDHTRSLFQQGARLGGSDFLAGFDMDRF